LNHTRISYLKPSRKEITPFFGLAVWGDWDEEHPVDMVFDLIHEKWTVTAVDHG